MSEFVLHYRIIDKPIFEDQIDYEDHITRLLNTGRITGSFEQIHEIDLCPEVHLIPFDPPFNFYNEQFDYAEQSGELYELCLKLTFPTIETMTIFKMQHADRIRSDG